MTNDTSVNTGTIDDTIPKNVSRNIVVVDDEKGMRMLCGAILEMEGHKVTEFSDAFSALPYFQEHKDIDYLISDINMPGMSGIALAEKLYDSHKDTKKYLMTGLIDQPLKDRLDALKEKGVIHGYLAKPFKNDSLLNLIE